MRLRSRWRLMHRGPRVAALAAAALVLLAVTGASTATNTVPGSRLGVASAPITLNDLAPDVCKSLDLTTLILAVDKVTRGTKSNDLIFGQASGQTINGQQGNDCLVGNGGIDTIAGNQGFDICIAGAGSTVDCEVVVTW